MVTSPLWGGNLFPQLYHLSLCLQIFDLQGTGRSVMLGLFRQHLCPQLYMGLSEVVSISSNLLKSSMCRCVLDLKGFSVRQSRTDDQLSAHRSRPDLAPRAIDPVAEEHRLVALPVTECEPGLLRWQ